MQVTKPTYTILNEDYRVALFDERVKEANVVITSPPFHPEDIGFSSEEAYMLWYKQLVIDLTSLPRVDYAFIFNSPTRRKEIYRQTDPFEEITWIRAPSCYKYKTQPIFVYQSSRASYNFRKPMWSDTLMLPEENGQMNIENLRTAIMVEPVWKAMDGILDTTYTSRPAGFVHPYEDPVDIYTYLLRMQIMGNPSTTLAFDPFCGTGTCGVASLRLGLNFIGSEKDPTWARHSEERLSRTLTSEEHDTRSWT
jgi:DNA modification methylase